MKPQTNIPLVSGRRVPRLIAGGRIRSCACGCGEFPGLYTKTRHTRGYVAGQPRRFAPGHVMSASPALFGPRLQDAPRFVLEDRGYETPCWIWQCATSDRGYGTLTVDGRTAYVHRFMYEKHIGPIPAGKEIDHLCRVRACCNPNHLEAVTSAENTQRGSVAKLTPWQVTEIRLLYKLGRHTQAELAHMYQIAESGVNRIINGTLWAEGHRP